MESLAVHLKRTSSYSTQSLSFTVKSDRRVEPFGYSSFQDPSFKIQVPRFKFPGFQFEDFSFQFQFLRMGKEPVWSPQSLHSSSRVYS